MLNVQQVRLALYFCLRLVSGTTIFKRLTENGCLKVTNFYSAEFDLLCLMHLLAYRKKMWEILFLKISHRREGK